jgi:hypothetical protein
MSKVKQQLQVIRKLTIFSGNTIIAQFMCKNVNEINAILVKYADSGFTYKVVSFDAVLDELNSHIVPDKFIKSKWHAR